MLQGPPLGESWKKPFYRIDVVGFEDFKSENAWNFSSFEIKNGKFLFMKKLKKIYITYMNN